MPEPLGAPAPPPPPPSPRFEVAWTYDAQGAFGPAGPRVAAGHALVATRHGEVHVVALERGRAAGVGAFGDAVEGEVALSPDGQRLFVPVARGRAGVACHVVTTGVACWTARLGAHVAGLALTPDGSRLVAAAYDGTVRALDAATGAVAWEARPDTLARLLATPLLAGGLAVVADDRGAVRAFDVATGALVWTAAAGAPVHRTPALAAGRLFVPTTRGRLVALEAATGAALWTDDAWAAGMGDFVRLTTPAASEALVVVGSTGGLVRALDPASGAERWHYRVRGNVGAAPLLAGAWVVVGTARRALLVLEAASGAPAWETTLRGRVRSAPVLAGDLLLVQAEPRHLVALRPVSAPPTDASPGASNPARR
ncbi:MAG: PQQ-binding-like beta-propeller repeat protein [Rubricoccaceae bacterium]